MTTSSDENLIEQANFRIRCEDGVPLYLLSEHNTLDHIRLEFKQSPYVLDWSTLETKRDGQWVSVY
jgi:hypothetical protein